MEGSGTQTVHPRSAGPAPAPGVAAQPRWAQCAWLALALGLTAFVYAPITRNFFNADDFFNLYRIVNKSLPEFLLYMQGGHLLITRNAVFMLCFAAFGTHAAAYFWLVLAVHLFNVALLFGIVRDLAGSARLASFGAGLWGILPVQEGTLGWYAVFGHVLVATCTLLVLAGLARAASGRAVPASAPWLWALLLLAGATSFGVGIGVAWAMPLVALLLLPASPLRRRTVLAFCAVAIMVPLLYIGSERLFGAFYGRVPPSRVLIASLLYWRGLAGLLAHLIAFGIDCVALGVLRPALAYPGAAAYAVVAVYAALVLGVLARSPGSTRRRILACLAIGIGAYGVIAAGRGGFTGTFAPGSMAQMARFHYVGTAALVLVTCLALAEIARRRPWPSVAATTLLLVWAAATAIIHQAIATPIEHFDAARRETAAALAEIGSAARTASAGGSVYIENQTFLSVGPMLAASRAAFPGWAGLATLYFPDGLADGRRIYFVDEPAVLEAVRRDRRTAALLVGAPDAPATIYRPTARPAATPSALPQTE